MQFANRLPFNQHLVPRYSESPAVPQSFSIWGDGKTSPQTLHQVSASVVVNVRSVYYAESMHQIG